MSIAFSIIRLVPERAKLRYLLFAVVVLFGCSWAALMLQKIWVCARTDHWKVPPTYQCFLGDAVGIITLASTSCKFSNALILLPNPLPNFSDSFSLADVVADASLIIIPLMLLREIRISRSQRRLLLAIFSSSLFSSFAGVVYAVFVFQADSFPKKKRNILLSLTANVKASLMFISSPQPATWQLTPLTPIWHDVVMFHRPQPPCWCATFSSSSPTSIAHSDAESIWRPSHPHPRPRISP